MVLPKKASFACVLAYFSDDVVYAGETMVPPIRGTGARH